MTGALTQADLDAGAAARAVARQELIAQFVGVRVPYYAAAFKQVEAAKGLPWSFNLMAALLGPLWMAARNLWSGFWISLFVQGLGVVLMARGWFGQLGAEQQEKAAQLSKTAAERAVQAKEALAQGADNAKQLAENSATLEQAATAARAAADLAVLGGPIQGWLGLAVFVAGALLSGLLANALLERRFLDWRTDRSLRTGLDPLGGMVGLFITVMAVGLSAWRSMLGKAEAPQFVFPALRETRNQVSRWLDAAFDRWAKGGEWFFDALKHGVRNILDLLELALVATPWPVVCVVVLMLAWRLSGVRTTIWTAVGLSYLLVFGFWPSSMATMALLGTAAFICILVGIPLGVWFARSERANAIARPVLDFMQTMPSFVYLIPVIAFFGTGKPPGILATLVFGMPPVIRLTTLGLKQVPESVVEAATAFGASRWYLLTRVEVPLALPSIMAGINQTILMCLSMVVIASLIGAKGLGEEVLKALEYAAQGEGILTGVAILVCAMVLDRLVQGKTKV
jgi:glycine betaine/proline transport system permease protein